MGLTSQAIAAQPVSLFDDLTVIIPTYNEAEAIPVLLARLGAHYPGAHVIIADDDSTDGTRERALAFDGSLHVHVLHRTSESVKGLTGSVVDALKMVETKHFIIMDADLQHPPEAVLNVYKHASNGAELAVGTRLDYEPLTLGRRAISQGARGLTRSYLRAQGKPIVEDPMSGFFGGKTLFAREVLEQHEHEFEKPGFKVLVDFLRFSPPNTRVAEVPYQFGERSAGESKMRLSHAFSLLRQLGPVGKLVSYTLLSLLSPTFWKFATVGLSGVFVNQALLFAGHGVAGLPMAVAALIAIEAAILWNFTWNDRWAFAGRARHRTWTSRMMRFNIHCMAGAAINIAILHILTYEAGFHYLLANLVGIGAAMAWNWSLSKAWTWRGSLDEARELS